MTATTFEDRARRLVDLDEGRVHVDVYSDEEVFREELRRIWYRTWVYLGHESEIAHPGDYKTTYIGLVPVILSRDADGGIHGLVNRCVHRGATVCQQERGNSKYFRCEYHGWVYGRGGELLGVASRQGYDDREVKRFEPGLQRLPRVESYRGCVFGSLAEDGESLLDHLGNAAYFLDCWANQSPSGRVDLTKGSWRHRYRGNWKLQVEAANEGYHPEQLHKIVYQHFGRMASKRGRTPPSSRDQGRGGSSAADLLHGHSILGSTGLLAASDQDLADRRELDRYPPAYVEAVERRVGGDARRLADALGWWRLGVFPNVAFNRGNVRVTRPLAPDLTEVTQYFVRTLDAPEEVNRAKLAEENDFYGPAGFGAPDDLECFERIHEGLRAASWPGAYPWVWFNRQLTRQWEGPRGERCTERTGEANAFAIYHEWSRLMAVPADAAVTA